MAKDLRMIKNIALLGILVLIMVMLAGAGEKTRTFTGDIADSQCAMNIHSLTRSHTEMMKNKNMGGTATNCANYCIKYLGGDFVLAKGNEVYRLDDQEKAASFAGTKVKVIGTLDEKTKTIHVIEIKSGE
jgi:hypothetical protein